MLAWSTGRYNIICRERSTGMFLMNRGEGICDDNVMLLVRSRSGHVKIALGTKRIRSQNNWLA